MLNGKTNIKMETLTNKNQLADLIQNKLYAEINGIECEEAIKDYFDEDDFDSIKLFPKNYFDCVVDFGQYKSSTLYSILEKDENYFNWLLDTNSFKVKTFINS